MILPPYSWLAMLMYTADKLTHVLVFYKDRTSGRVKHPMEFMRTHSLFHLVKVRPPKLEHVF